MYAVVSTRTVALAIAFTIAIVACTTHTQQPEPHHPTLLTPTSNVQRGLATWYADDQQTASGERFDKRKLTAAHRTLPFGTRVRVTNTHNGRSVEVRINDRGPYSGHDRIIDLSEAAARQLQMIDDGVVSVTVEVLR